MCCSTHNAALRLWPAWRERDDAYLPSSSVTILCPVRREVDEDGEGAPWKEQETWEGEQIKKASMRVGAQDRARAAAQYDFVIDDQIEFIKDQALAGDLVRRGSLCPAGPGVLRDAGAGQILCAVYVAAVRSEHMQSGADDMRVAAWQPCKAGAWESWRLAMPGLVCEKRSTRVAHGVAHGLMP